MRPCRLTDGSNSKRVKSRLVTLAPIWELTSSVSYVFNGTASDALTLQRPILLCIMAVVRKCGPPDAGWG